MNFRQTALSGVFLIDPEPKEDQRGFFARTVCAHEFAVHGLTAHFVQASISFNRWRHTLRGLHFQRAPHEEDKLVRCTSGALYDVVVDLRPQSSTYLNWFGVELTAANRRALYVPKGLAHGFVTLADRTELLYQMSAFYAPGFADGIRWNDPRIGIAWPVPEPIISDRDANYPDVTS
jgi:dTDP-4-dehydrorhamnose 3,5-epimerase